MSRHPSTRDAAYGAAPELPSGLVYVTDDKPGIRRLRKGGMFVYRGPDGKSLRAAADLARIRSLVIPPAYEDVWICPLPHGHLQATGRDARGRKQYRYHPKWHVARDADKFERMLEFGAALPKIRRQVQKELSAPIGQAPGRASVLAAIVRLLDTTLIRIGNDEYARTNGTYGLTTLRRRHAAVAGSKLRLHFRGKSGVEHEVSLDDPRVTRVVRRCQAMPGQELLRYEDEKGSRHVLGSSDVNDYLRELSGASFTAKDFRTWHGSVDALDVWTRELGVEADERRSANQLIADVAKRLGNSVAVCRKAYIHPKVLEALMSDADAAPEWVDAKQRRGLDPAEQRLLVFLSDSA